jgi:hypothetical protein
VLERNRAGAYLSSLLVGAGLFAMFLFLTYYMQQNLGYSPLRSGFAFLPFSGGIVAAPATASALLPKVGARALLIAGGLLGTAGLAYLTLITNDSSWVIPLIHGVASAMLNTSQQIGGSLGTALLNTLFASAVANYLVSHHGRPVITQPEAAIHGYHVAFGVGAGLIGPSTVLAGLLVRIGSTNEDDINTAATERNE